MTEETTQRSEGQQEGEKQSTEPESINPTDANGRGNLKTNGRGNQMRKDRNLEMLGNGRAEWRWAYSLELIVELPPRYSQIDFDSSSGVRDLFIKHPRGFDFHEKQLVRLFLRTLAERHRKEQAMLNLKLSGD